MEFWFTLLLIVHVLVAVVIIGLVLLQQGKGAEMGAAFGSGASGSVFGATGSANFLSRTTAILVALFFLSSLGLAYVAANKPKAATAVDRVLTVPSAETPAEVPSAEVPPADAPKEAKPNEVPQ